MQTSFHGTTLLSLFTGENSQEWILGWKAKQALQDWAPAPPFLGRGRFGLLGSGVGGAGIVFPCLSGW